MSREEWADIKEKLEAVKADKACPNCGYCPHCGHAPYRAAPYIPYYPPPTVYPGTLPWWQQPVWTSGNSITTGGTGAVPPLTTGVVSVQNNGGGYASYTD